MLRSTLLLALALTSASAVEVCNTEQTKSWTTFLQTPVDVSCTNGVAAITLPVQFFSGNNSTNSTACPNQTCLTYFENKLSALPMCAVNGSSTDLHSVFYKAKAACSNGGKTTNSTTAPTNSTTAPTNVTTVPVVTTDAPITTVSPTTKKPTATTLAPSGVSATTLSVVAATATLAATMW
ncbi:hypothetical protein SPRG_01753 [Saprolegnia parasitica CBS 223.65]|uniref:Secreted protein n=1 Tax=Saprolegnia parasitica (strain CBS 223.65) TaxID=695850 RepID=A0A067CTP0_SAPPC|nr:hypothetical protein SPRG_01753 [Saprolegnia parasitica CBS 223.65]KDO33873.1 hypothetical protein SPRG_01753 [Saprolegnia parasitica CBS 223.65]|eukprot:XP_012195509.1 hypothetical protein SPRG_01753 [Saprolegnia parasitica CBS 223.65]